MARVLHIVESLEAGGAERVVVEYALAHDRSRYEPEVCAVLGAGPLASALSDAGVRLHVLRRRVKFDPAAILRLARVIRSGPFDVVHTHNFAALSVGAPAAALAGAPALVRTEHNVVRRHFPFRNRMSRLAAARESAQIAVSEAVRQSHLAAGRIPPDRFVTIRNGIDDRRMRVDRGRDDVREELGIGRDAFVCLTVASLTAQKDHGNLLRAAVDVSRATPEAVFLIAGRGPREGRLVEEAGELGMEGSVRFLGRRLDVPLLMRSADVFVLPSAWEGLPITILEAIAGGLPCVATAVGGVPEVVEDGRSGYLVAPHDPASLADRILRLAGDPEGRRSMARRAREIYERGFTAAHMTRQTEALYDMVLAREFGRTMGEGTRLALEESRSAHAA